jgi:uncharacterized protein YoaH (UPF0181 family)
MTGKTTLNKTDQRKAITRVFSLVKNGTTITDARKIVAEEIRVSPNTLWVWQKRHNMVAPNATLVRTNGSIVKPSTTTREAIHGISNVKNELGHVFQSLVTKDGRFTSKEAGAISQVSSNILGLARFELEVHKYADKATKRDKVVTNLLT